MIRFLMVRKQMDSCTGVAWSSFYTIDEDTEALERDLQSGGRGENGYDLTELLGVEIIRQPDNNLTSEAI